MMRHGDHQLVSVCRTQSRDMVFTTMSADKNKNSTEEENICTEIKITQEGVSVSVYDLNAERGSEFVDETYYFWNEIGVTLHENKDAIESKMIQVTTSGELTTSSLDGV